MFSFRHCILGGGGGPVGVGRCNGKVKQSFHCWLSPSPLLPSISICAINDFNNAFNTGNNDSLAFAKDSNPDSTFDTYGIYDGTDDTLDFAKEWCSSYEICPLFPECSWYSIIIILTMTSS